MAQSVLIIGGEMYLGRLLQERLAGADFRLRCIDSLPGAAQADALCDRDVLTRMCTGIDAVVDISKLDSRRWADGDVVRSAEGLAALWEAARVAKVRRVITLVSDGVVGFYRRSAVLDHLSLARPDGPLGLVGALAESMSSLYACKHALSTMCIRMGSCRPTPVDERMLSTWISPDDFIRLIRMALTADYTSEVVYGISRNARSWWDNSNAFRLGYRPQDRAEDYADALDYRRSTNPVENAFQGGPGAAVDFTGDIRRIP